MIRCLSMCTVENFKNHPGLHRVSVCHWSAGDVFAVWFSEGGLMLDTSQVHVCDIIYFNLIQCCFKFSDFFFLRKV